MAPLDFESIELPAEGVQSLCWKGDILVDWVGGVRCFHLNGTVESRRVSFPYRFDSVVASPSRRFIAIYERLGTKALLLENGNIIRELNRSFYHAHAYEYPI